MPAAPAASSGSSGSTALFSGGGRSALVAAGVAVVVAAAAAAAAGWRGRDVVVGMDLGTSYSTVAYRVGGPQAPVSMVRWGPRNATTTPSVVAIHPTTGNWWVGPRASELAAAGLTAGGGDWTVVFDTKRVIGRRWDDPVVAVEASRHGLGRLVRHPAAQRDAWGRAPTSSRCTTCEPDLAFVIAVPPSAGDGTRLASHQCIDRGSLIPAASVPTWWQSGGHGHEPLSPSPFPAGLPLIALTPTAVGCMIVHTMMSALASSTGLPFPKSSVVTVPAEAALGARAATEDAYKRAGITPRRVLMEPAAAAVAYGLHHNPDVHHILVFDMGGGTLDVTLMWVQEGSFTLVGSAGDPHLGGEDFDECVMGIMRQAQAIPADAVPCDLKAEAERVKILLGDGKAEQATWRCGPDIGGTIDVAQWNAACGPLFLRSLDPVTTALSAAGLRREEVDEVVLVGGCSRLLGVRDALAHYFGVTREELRWSVDPDTAVAVGAATVVD